jgi:hypothetical protein
VVSPDTLGFLGLTPFHAETLSAAAAEFAAASGIRASDVNRFGQSGWASLAFASNWSVLEWLLDHTEESVPADAVSYAARRWIPSTLLVRFIDRAAEIPAEVVARVLPGDARRTLVRRVGIEGWSPLERALLSGADLAKHESEPLLLDAVAHVQPDRIGELSEALRMGAGYLHAALILDEILGWDSTKQLAEQGVIGPIDSATRLSIVRRFAYNGDTRTLAQLLSEGGFDAGALVETYAPPRETMRMCLTAARGAATRTSNRLSYLEKWLSVVDVEDPELRAEFVANVDLNLEPVRWAAMPDWFVCGTLARFDDALRPARTGSWLRALVWMMESRGFLPRGHQAFDAVFQRWPSPPEGSLLAACQQPSIPRAWTKVLLELGVDSEQVEARWSPAHNSSAVSNISALGMACYYARVGNAAMLLRAGADPERPVNGGASVAKLAKQWPVVKRTLAAAQQLVADRA